VAGQIANRVPENSREHESLNNLLGSQGNYRQLA